MSEEVINDFVEKRTRGKRRKSRFLTCPSVETVGQFRAIDSWLRSWVGWYVDNMVNENGIVDPSRVEWGLRNSRKYMKNRVDDLNYLLDRYAKIKKGGLNYKALEDFNKTRKWDVYKTLARMDELLEIPEEERYKLENLVPESYRRVRTTVMRNLKTVVKNFENVLSHRERE